MTDFKNRSPYMELCLCRRWIYHTSVAAVSLRLSRIQKRIRQFVAENGGLRND